MGRFLLCGKEANLPYEVEELDLRLYTVEELCYYIYNNLALIGDDFIDERLFGFIREELNLPEEADRIARFYKSPSDQDATLLMFLTDIGYYTDTELTEFQNRLVSKRRRNGPERILQKADFLFEKKRYLKAIRFYRALANDFADNRITAEIRARVYESIANAYGMLYDYEDAVAYLLKAYNETKTEALLRKIYEVTVLSGMELPERLTSTVPEAKLASWQQDYWLKESGVKNRVQEDETMKVFFREKKEMEEEPMAQLWGVKSDYEE